VIICKVGCTGAARSNKSYWVRPIAVRSTGIGVGRRSRNGPLLVIGADILVLNRYDFSLLKQCQKYVDVFIVISQMADIDAGRTDLGGVVP
jgi:hypothetical protein